VRIITFANQKGGTGKTTTVMNVGMALGEMGKKVLMVDLDHQGSLTIYAGVEDPNEELEVTINDVMLSYALLKDPPMLLSSIIKNVRDNVWIAQANNQLATFDLDIAQAMSRETVLDRALEPIKDQYDYILLDVHPSLSLLNMNALVASTDLVIPLSADYLSSKGVEQLLESVVAVRKVHNPKLNIAGILITRADFRTKHANEIIEATRQSFKNAIPVFETVIKEAVSLKDAPRHGKDIFLYDPKSESATAYRNLAHEIFNNGK
jgi:chromosome partitioning protein